MKQFGMIAIGVAIGAGALYLYSRHTRPAPATTSGPASIFDQVFGALKGGASLLEPFWGSSPESGHPGGSTNRTASSFANAFIDLDDSAPTTMTVSPGLYTVA